MGPFVAWALVVSCWIAVGIIAVALDGLWPERTGTKAMPPSTTRWS
jgi:hypothetical protein